MMGIPTRSDVCGEVPEAAVIAENHTIRDRSHLSLGYNETYFTLRKGGYLVFVSALCLLDPNRWMTLDALVDHVRLRDYVDSFLLRPGYLVVNGVYYEEDCESLVVGGASCQEFADLFGRPVRQSNGDVFEPAAWAAMEVQLIRDYRCSGANLALVCAYNIQSARHLAAALPH
jgi:hypothetical protein